MADTSQAEAESKRIDVVQPKHNPITSPLEK